MGKAGQWFRKAAEQGDPEAQESLGLLYAEGSGVKKDLAEAEKWLRKAADLGNENARANLEILRTVRGK
ncbi:MAG: sel1 repeat family protein, partial [Nitrospinota bacterium]|nr:sel1 repeat family protein [Nitrospinota bacterium]